MSLWTAIFWCGVAASLGLIAVGSAFLVAPEPTLSVVDHTTEKLPQVMGGRYIFFGVVLLGALLRKDHVVLAGLLLAFAGVAFIDALIYLGSNAAPHAIVGIICCIGAIATYRLRKVAS